MAKVIYVCLRDRLHDAATAHAVAAVAERLLPDNLPRIPSRTFVSDGVVAGISGDSDLIGVRGCSLAAGYLVEPGMWERPGTGRPDGAYALFRSNDAEVEIVTDTLASRTVWYVKTDRLFIASTSQRAIVALLGSFEFNPDAVSWMLAAGTLGPDQSWDKRIRCVKGATCVALDRRAWTLKEKTEPVRFEPRDVTDREHEGLMLEALRHAVSGAKVADPRWAIALSGGFDCRTILCLLRQTQGLRAVTWGLHASLDEPTNDASIARRLAGHFGLEHQYFETDLGTESVYRVFERFVTNGEGRIDHISGYGDGFSLWRKLHEIGVRGIVRGDEVFGMKARHSPRAVRFRCIPQWSDYSGVPSLESLGLPPQTIPQWLQQQGGESLATWRDRIQQQYRAPYIYAALSDLKLPYVEIINPLISGSVVDRVRQLPDEVRTDKMLLKKVARSLTPGIPFAKDTALQSETDMLKSPSILEVLRESLSSNSFCTVIPPKFIEYTLGGLTQTASRPRRTAGRRLRQAVRAAAPGWAARLLGSGAARPPPPAHNRLAFRAYLIERTSRLFAQDAVAIGCRVAHD